MSTAIYERIRNNPKFDILVAKRSRFAWTLTAIVLGIYFAFIMIVAFNPKLLATPIFAGGTASICLLYTSVCRATIVTPSRSAMASSA